MSRPPRDYSQKLSAALAHHLANPSPRKVTFWMGMAFPGLTAIMLIAAIVLLHSQRFHEYLLAKVNATASDTLNTEVHVENFALRLSPIGLDVYGVVVHGASPYSNPPLLQLQHAHVGLAITSLVRRKWFLTDVQLDHPVVQVFFDKNGKSNLPQPTPSNSKKSSTTIWGLGVRPAILDQGEIYDKSQAIPLSADLHNVDFRGAYDVAKTMYSGNLKYSNGRVLFADNQP